MNPKDVKILKTNLNKRNVVKKNLKLLMTINKNIKFFQIWQFKSLKKKKEIIFITPEMILNLLSLKSLRNNSAVALFLSADPINPFQISSHYSTALKAIKLSIHVNYAKLLFHLNFVLYIFVETE